MNPQEINEAVAKKLGCKCNPRGIGDGKYLCILCTTNYCGDIRAAWEILDQWNGDWELHRQNGAFDFVLYRPSEQYDAQSDTAPQAICLAFLKLEEIKLDRKG